MDGTVVRRATEGRRHNAAAPARSVEVGDRGEVRDRGAVTAEFAITLPVLIAVSLALAWLLSLVVSQGQLTAAAREGARAAARGDDPAQIRAAAARAAPGAAVTVQRSGQLVRVRVSEIKRGPGLLLRGLEQELAAEAVSAREPGS
ncbi:MAG: TadE family type IV pilus minor pilin [Candidatus Nanopelagicales bacterium]